MPALDPSSFDALLFDLGGVLLPLEPKATVNAFARLSVNGSFPAFDAEGQAGWVDRYERGEISSEEFRDLARRDLGSPELTDTDIDAAWNAMLGRLPEARVELLLTLRAHKRLFLLSNTNVIHLRSFQSGYDLDHAARFGSWSSLFERDHYSHTLGMRKPEPRAFEQLVKWHELTPARTVFIDDNAGHVASARGLGFQVRHHPSNQPLTPYFTNLTRELPRGA